MNRAVKLVDSRGRELFKDEVNDEVFFAPKPVQSPAVPPKDLREFEDRLEEVYLHFQEKFFGLAQDIGSGKTIRRGRDCADLVQALFDLENRINRAGDVFCYVAEGYAFLKTVLESDAPLFGADLYLLGLHRDRSGISKAQENEIAVRCGAQVLWRVQNERFPTIETMVAELMKKGSLLFQLLELHRFQSRRTIRNWVQAVFPVPVDQRKGRPRRERGAINFDALRMIPGVFAEEGVSFPRLRFALICFSRILKILGWEKSQVIASPFVRQLVEPLRWYPRLYVEHWVGDAYSENGSIFTP